MKRRIFLVALLMGFVSVMQAQIKIGIIGLDTSHSIAFTKFLNGEPKKEEYRDFKIVAAYPYGSGTIESSYKRIPDYIEQVKKMGVEIVPSIAELLKKVDCVMLETNDGNIHLEQANEVFKAGKITFIDKPMGASLAQTMAIYQLARQYKIPVFSSSSLRYVTQTQKIRKGEFGKVQGADCYSPAHKEISHPDFGWYGIHGVETLFTVMGTGCVAVNRISSDHTDVVTGLWQGGRIGTFRGLQQEKTGYGGTAFTDTGIVSVGTYEGYEVLLKEILQFFKTKVVPVSERETVEIFAFMEASNVSKRNQGKIVYIEDVFRQGQREAEELLRNLK